MDPYDPRISHQISHYLGKPSASSAYPESRRPSPKHSRMTHVPPTRNSSASNTLAAIRKTSIDDAEHLVARLQARNMRSDLDDDPGDIRSQRQR
jgi:hypothetical protein